jgi:hypothetical protein
MIKSLARAPWGTDALDKLRLLSPRTWFEVLKTMTILDFSPALDLDALSRGWLRIFLPLVLLSCTAALHNSLVETNNHLDTMRLIMSASISPWALACLLEMKNELNMISQMPKQLTQYRKPPLPEAIFELQERIDNKRAHRTRRYDLYLPAEHRYSGKALLFLPGKMVPHSAYSEVAAQLSDLGIVVVVLSAEPLRIAALISPEDVMRIIHKVNRSLPNNPPTKWSVGGHSSGAYSAMRLMPRLIASLESTPDLVMWAAGPLEGWRINIHEEPCRALVLLGTCDVMCQFTRQGRKNFQKDLPRRTTQKMIRGGNHCGFASYPGTPTFDGIAKISRQRQHKVVASATATFLSRDS